MKKILSIAMIVLCTCFVANALSFELDASTVIAGDSKYSYKDYIDNWQILETSESITVGSTPIGLDVGLRVPIIPIGEKFDFGLSCDLGSTIGKGLKQSKDSLLLRMLVQNGTINIPGGAKSFSVPVTDNSDCVNTNFYASVGPMMRFNPSDMHTISFAPGLLCEATVSRMYGKLVYDTTTGLFSKSSEQFVTLDFALDFNFGYKFWLVRKSDFKFGLNAGLDLAVPVFGSISRTDDSSNGLYELEIDGTNAKLMLGVAFDFAGKKSNK